MTDERIQFFFIMHIKWRMYWRHKCRRCETDKTNDNFETYTSKRSMRSAPMLETFADIAVDIIECKTLKRLTVSH